jgi:hypothetical protein
MSARRKIDSLDIALEHQSASLDESTVLKASKEEAGKDNVVNRKKNFTRTQQHEKVQILSLHVFLHRRASSVASRAARSLTEGRFPCHCLVPLLCK